MPNDYGIPTTVLQELKDDCYQANKHGDSVLISPSKLSQILIALESNTDRMVALQRVVNNAAAAIPNCYAYAALHLKPEIELLRRMARTESKPTGE